MSATSEDHVVTSQMTLSVTTSAKAPVSGAALEREAITLTKTERSGDADRIPSGKSRKRVMTQSEVMGWACSKQLQPPK